MPDKRGQLYIYYGNRHTGTLWLDEKQRFVFAYDPDRLQPRHWERLADSIGLKRRYVLTVARNMASRIVDEAESLVRAFEEDREGWKGLHSIVGLAKRRSEKGWEHS